MPEHPLFERLMARLDEIENRIVSLEDRAAEQRDDLKVASEHLDRLADNMSSFDHDFEEIRGTAGAFEQIAEEFVQLRSTLSRAEWQSWLPAQAQENIRRAS